MVSAEEKQRVGLLIKKRRQQMGLRSQRELAVRLGINRTSVANWEAGKHYPGKYLGALEDVLGISLTGDGAEPEPPVDPRERDLWALLVADGLTAAEAQRFIEEVRRTRRRAG